MTEGGSPRRPWRLGTNEGCRGAACPKVGDGGAHRVDGGEHPVLLSSPGEGERINPLRFRVEVLGAESARVRDAERLPVAGSGKPVEGVGAPQTIAVRAPLFPQAVVVVRQLGGV